MICLKCNGTGKIKFSYTQRSRLVASTQLATAVDKLVDLGFGIEAKCEIFCR